MRRASWPLTTWESSLTVAIGLAVAVNAAASPFFLDVWALSDATYNFTEKALVALPMALLIIAREIDISAAAIMALASVMMGLAAAAGAPTPALVAVGLLTGLGCGLVNGVLVTALHAPAIVVTIGTLSLFRGTAYAILGDGVLKSYPPSFAVLGQGYVWGAVTVELALLVVAAAAFAVLLHASKLGRRIVAIGVNPVAARFTGVPVDRIRLGLFALTGLMAGLASALLTSRLGATRPTVASGWELDVITMAILGGVAIEGGRGTILGVMLAAVLVGLVTFGLALLNIPGVVVQIVTGSLLILVVAAQQVGRRRRRH